MTRVAAAAAQRKQITFEYSTTELTSNYRTIECSRRHTEMILWQRNVRVCMLLLNRLITVVMRTSLDWKSMSLTNWAVHAVKQMIRDKRRTVEDSSTIQDLCP